MARPPSQEPGISRIDQPARRTYGWFVRVYVDGLTLAKFFPDATHGTRRKALLAARAHRDAVRAAAAGTPPRDFGDYYITRMEYARVQGWWVRIPNPKGKPFAKLFSDKKHGGKKEARAAAVVWRDMLATNLQLVTNAE